jgi:hypothetical protein
MRLEKFKEDLDGSPPGPPYQISAGKLDRNFARCYPKDWDGDKKPYAVKRDEDGYFLELSFWPPPSGGTFVLGARGGSLVWLATEECEEQ